MNANQVIYARVKPLFVVKNEPSITHMINQKKIIPIHSRRQENQIWSKQRLHNRQGNSSCLINNQKLHLRELFMIIRLNILHRKMQITKDYIKDHLNRKYVNIHQLCTRTPSAVIIHSKKELFQKEKKMVDDRVWIHTIFIWRINLIMRSAVIFHAWPE